ncbi:glycerophosphodiester phosphodiesterase family protein [Peloplasma aerotolerans]|uniref:Glycerophosphodiester phosphodiesterase family protein n=1 Tax=Peloplasma aerotolerans TaxID=3044389 RepID=A0AAW6U5R6_9MOLU|nr:glycerophosphodiester phosphodiesterase family protein [Mariniplasma sp. M4Ah]MDI6453321.1 glycerophosphodiester phosphodiesterase family protein [Mariniplasma sp. M4Ah]
MKDKKLRKISIAKKVILGLILIYIVLLFLPRPQNVEGSNPFRISSDQDVLLIAHGGGNHEFPDNTLEAFYNAFHIDPNVMMETDVSLTKDGVIILSHDTTLDRKTTLTNALIIETNYSDLVEQEIDFGYHNEVVPRSNGFNVSGVFNYYVNYLGDSVTPLDVIYPDDVQARHETKFLVSTLEDLIKAFPNNPINVEIKQYGDIGLRALDKVIELMDALDEEYETFGRIVLASFHQEVFQSMLSYKNTTHPFLMISPEQNSVIKFYVLQLLGLSFFYRDPVNVLQLPTGQYGLSLSTKSLIKMAHQHNIAVHYWTIDDEDEMRRLILNGADGIMTNRPSVLKQVIEEMRP